MTTLTLRVWWTATALLLPSRRPVRESRAASPRGDAPAAPGARRTRPALGVRGGCADQLPIRADTSPSAAGSGCALPARREPASAGKGGPLSDGTTPARAPAVRAGHMRPAAASPRTPAAGPVVYRVGRAPVPVRGAA